MPYIKITDATGVDEIIPFDINHNEVPKYYEEIFSQVQKRNPRLKLFHTVDSETCLMEIYKEEKKITKGFLYSTKRTVKKLMYSINLVNVNTSINIFNNTQVRKQECVINTTEDISLRDKFLTELKSKILKIN